MAVHCGLRYESMAGGPVSLCCIGISAALCEVYSIGER